nr:helix-turn-helix domain-containing protein [Micromonospora sp. DSM 115978]
MTHGADDQNAGANRLAELVAEEVAAALGRRRMTGAALAAAIGASEMYISRRLNKQTAFSLNDLDRIARALGVSVLDLLPRDAASVTLT